MPTDSDTDDGTPMTVAGVTVGTPDGGDLVLDAEKPMRAPDGLELSQTGAAFGPLEISAYPGSTARIGGLEFLEQQSFLDTLFGSGAGEGLFGTAVAVGSAERDRDRTNNTATRRDVLKAAGLGVTAAASTGVAAAQTTESYYRKAQFETTENPEGIRVRVFDRAESYLPPDTAYYTYVNGQDYGRFAAATDAGYGDILPTKEGNIMVGPEGSGSFLEALRADKTVIYDGISLPKSTTEAQTGEKLVLSTNDILVEAVQRVGGDETMLSLNGESIPERSEDIESTLGYYGVSDDRLVYIVGREPPAATSAKLTIYADRSDELLDDISRGVSG